METKMRYTAIDGLIDGSSITCDCDKVVDIWYTNGEHAICEDCFNKLFFKVSVVCLKCDTLIEVTTTHLVSRNKIKCPVGCRTKYLIYTDGYERTEK